MKEYPFTEEKLQYFKLLKEEKAQDLRIEEIKAEIRKLYRDMSKLQDEHFKLTGRKLREGYDY